MNHKKVNTMTSKNYYLKIQFWLLIVFYIIFLFYSLGNSNKIISDKCLNSIAFNEIITLYKIILFGHSIYFSY